MFTLAGTKKDLASFDSMGRYRIVTRGYDFDGLITPHIESIVKVK